MVGLGYGVLGLGYEVSEVEPRSPTCAKQKTCKNARKIKNDSQRGAEVAINPCKTNILQFYAYFTRVLAIWPGGCPAEGGRGEVNLPSLIGSKTTLDRGSTDSNGDLAHRFHCVYLAFTAHLPHNY